MSDTPRTDANTWATGEERLAEKTDVVDADFARELERELAAAIKQRDEARRMWCRIISLQRRGAGENFAPEDIAVEYGWDCFAEGGGA